MLNQSDRLQPQIFKLQIAVDFSGMAGSCWYNQVSMPYSRIWQKILFSFYCLNEDRDARNAVIIALSKAGTAFCCILVCDLVTSEKRADLPEVFSF